MSTVFSILLDVFVIIMIIIISNARSLYVLHTEIHGSHTLKNVIVITINFI
jgi:hypothetical protein